MAGFLEEEALHWGLEERCELEEEAGKGIPYGRKSLSKGVERR